MVLSSPTIILVVQFAVIAVFIRAYFFPTVDLDSIIGGSRGTGALTAYINDSYDYIVVGGGSAGSVVASRLAEDSGVNVLLLEAGPSDENSPVLDIPIANPRSIGTSLDWQYLTVPQKHACKAMKEQRSQWVSGKVLGGTSQLNFMLYVRGHRLDYDEWAARGCEGWSYNDVLPYFKKSESIQDPDVAKFDHHGQKGPLPVRTDRFTTLGDVFAKAGAELGYPVKDNNDGNQEGFSLAQTTVKNGIRMSTSRAFLWPTLHRPNLHVAVRTHVTKILIENKRAVGVQFIQDDRVKIVRATKEVILSAGAVGSPHLLLLSGIGPRKHLEEKGITVHADLPVGESLQDHVIAPLRIFTEQDLSLSREKTDTFRTWIQYFIFKTGYMAASGIEASAFLRTASSLPKPDFEIELLALMLDAPSMKAFFNLDEHIVANTKWRKGNGFMMLPMLLNPKSVGNILLKSSNPLEYPLIDPKYLSDPEDVKVLIKAIRIIQKLLNTETYKSIGASLETKPLSICAHLQYDTDEYLECYIRGFTVAAYHGSGSCKMGSRTDPTAVVDPQLRVRGISGLRVADGSVIPVPISGNPNAPIIMIAEKAADLINGRKS